MKILVKFIISPLIFYLIFFIILSYPAILSFSGSLWADTGDGLQNVWNLWWVNKAITELHASVWFTDLLHFPHGTTLIGHTLNPINGISAIPLLKFLSLFQTYNLILLSAFVVSGLTAFILAFYLTKNYFASLASGYIYTFSQFHFAHAQGHLQTATIQFIPLFILFWMKFLNKPSLILSLASAVILYLNLLADYYLFFYCVLFAVLFYLWKLYFIKDLFLGHGKKLIFYLFIFLATVLATSGKIIASLIIQNLRDPLIGAHPAGMFSTDLLSLIIPGGHWRFSQFSQSFWSRLPGNIHESSVYLGASVIAMLIFMLLKIINKFNKRKIKKDDSNIIFFFIIFIFFLTLSFGPSLQINSFKTGGFPMPYTLMERFIPFISLSGMPVRMMVMVYLAAGIICAYGLSKLSQKTAKNKILIFLFLLVLFIDYFPSKIPVTQIIIPQSVNDLKKMPLAGVVDLSSSPSEALYFQTIHEKPVSGGYIARLPASVVWRDLELFSLIDDQEYDVLCSKYNFRYILFPSGVKTLKCNQNLL